jgi:hypothetical protein
MGASITNMMGNLNLNTNESLFPGTKLKAVDNNIYILLGYSSDMNNLICIKDGNMYNGHNITSFTIDNIKQIIHVSKPINYQKKFMYE